MLTDILTRIRQDGPPYRAEDVRVLLDVAEAAREYVRVSESAYALIAEGPQPRHILENAFAHEQRVYERLKVAAVGGADAR